MIVAQCLIVLSLLYLVIANVAVVRGAKGGPGQSQGAPQKGRNLTLKYNPGTYVYERKILVTQKNLKYHPGLNVSMVQFVIRVRNALTFYFLGVSGRTGSARQCNILDLRRHHGDYNGKSDNQLEA